jgi:hypothetical protein
MSLTCWKFGQNLYSSKLDRCTKLRIDTTRLDRVDDCTIGCVGGGDTVVEACACAAIAEEVERVVGVEQRFVLQRWLDHQVAIFVDEDIGVICGSLLEFTVARWNKSTALWDQEETESKTYPNPPTWTSRVHIFELSVGAAKVSVNTGQYESPTYGTTSRYILNAVTARPRKRPMTG